MGGRGVVDYKGKVVEIWREIEIVYNSGWCLTHAPTTFYFISTVLCLMYLGDGVVVLGDN